VPEDPLEEPPVEPDEPPLDPDVPAPPLPEYPPLPEEPLLPELPVPPVLPDDPDPDMPLLPLLPLVAPLWSEPAVRRSHPVTNIAPNKVSAKIDLEVFENWFIFFHSFQ
jgi:hypothetical protein